MAENPWDEFELGYVFFVRYWFCIDCISYEIQTCHAETFFVNGIIVKRVVSGYMSHANDGIVRVQNFVRMAEMKWVVSWSDGDFVSVGKFIIKGSAEIEIFCFISCCCAHIFLPPGAKIDILVERVYFEEYYHNLLFLCNIQILFFAQIKFGLYCW